MFGFKKVKSITTSELESRLRDRKVELLDVREGHEFSAGHIKGARNVPLSQVGMYSVSENARVFVICQSGMRSRQAYKILSKKEIDVTNITGGMNAWRGKTVK